MKVLKLFLNVDEICAIQNRIRFLKTEEKEAEKTIENIRNLTFTNISFKSIFSKTLWAADEDIFTYQNHINLPEFH